MELKLRDEIKLALRLENQLADLEEKQNRTRERLMTSLGLIGETLDREQKPILCRVGKTIYSVTKSETPNRVEPVEIREAKLVA